MTKFEPEGLIVSQGAPAASTILDGHSLVSGTALITIPAGKTWTGSVTLAASLNAATGATTAFPTVSVESAGGSSPAPATRVAALALSCPAEATPGSSVASSTTKDNVVVIAGANAVTLQLNTDTATVAAGSAVGYLV